MPADIHHLRGALVDAEHLQRLLAKRLQGQSNKLLWEGRTPTSRRGAVGDEQEQREEGSGRVMCGSRDSSVVEEV